MYPRKVNGDHDVNRGSQFGESPPCIKYKISYKVKRRYVTGNYRARSVIPARSCRVSPGSNIFFSEVNICIELSIVYSRVRFLNLDFFLL